MIFLDISPWQGESPGDPRYEVGEDQFANGKAFILLVI